MATLEKVNRFFAIEAFSNSHNAITNQVAAAQVPPDFLEELSEKEREEFTEKHKAYINKISQIIIERIKVFYVEIFSDEEIDQLIEIYSTPILSKLLEALPEINQKIIGDMIQGDLKKELEEASQDFDDYMDNLMREERSEVEQKQTAPQGTTVH